MAEWIPLSGKDKERAEDEMLRFKKALDKEFRKGRFTADRCREMVKEKEIELGLVQPPSAAAPAEELPAPSEVPEEPKPAEEIPSEQAQPELPAEAPQEEAPLPPLEEPTPTEETPPEPAEEIPPAEPAPVQEPQPEEPQPIPKEEALPVELGTQPPPEGVPEPPEEPAPEQPETITCESCGATLSKDVAVCEICGAPIPGKEEQVAEEPAPSEGQGEQPAEPTPTASAWIPLSPKDQKRAEKELLHFKKYLEKEFKKGRMSAEECKTQVKQKEIELGLVPPPEGETPAGELPEEAPSEAAPEEVPAEAPAEEAPAEPTPEEKPEEVQPETPVEVPTEEPVEEPVPEETPGEEVAVEMLECPACGAASPMGTQKCEVCGTELLVKEEEGGAVPERIQEDEIPPPPVEEERIEEAPGPAPAVAPAFVPLSPKEQKYAEKELYKYKKYLDKEYRKGRMGADEAKVKIKEKEIELRLVAPAEVAYAPPVSEARPYTEVRETAPETSRIEVSAQAESRSEEYPRERPAEIPAREERAVEEPVREAEPFEAAAEEAQEAPQPAPAVAPVFIPLSPKEQKRAEKEIHHFKKYLDKEYRKGRIGAEEARTQIRKKEAELGLAPSAAEAPPAPEYPAPAEPEYPAPAEIPPEEPVREVPVEETIDCRFCGSAIPVDSEECMVCGKSFVEKPAEAIAPEVPPETQMPVEEVSTGEPSPVIAPVFTPLLPKEQKRAEKELHHFKKYLDKEYKKGRLGADEARTQIRKKEVELGLVSPAAEPSTAPSEEIPSELPIEAPAEEIPEALAVEEPVVEEPAPEIPPEEPSPPEEPAPIEAPSEAPVVAPAVVTLSPKEQKRAEKELHHFKKYLDKEYRKGRMSAEACKSQLKRKEAELGLAPSPTETPAAPEIKPVEEVPRYVEEELSEIPAEAPSRISEVTPVEEPKPEIPAEEMMECRFCGAQIPARSETCEICGEELIKKKELAPEEEVPPPPPAEEEAVEEAPPSPPPVITPVFVPLAPKELKHAEKELFKFKKYLDKEYRKGRMNADECRAQIRMKEIELGLVSPTAEAPPMPEYTTPTEEIPEPVEEVPAEIPVEEVPEAPAEAPVEEIPAAPSPREEGIPYNWREEWIDKPFREMPPEELAKQPPHVLKGVSEGDSRKMAAAFNIKTVEDFAKLDYAAWAQELVSLKETPSAYRKSDFEHKIDKEYEDMELEQLLQAPTSALQGVSEDDAKKLAKAFNAKTVEQLGNIKYLAWAHQISEMIPPAEKRRLEGQVVALPVEEAPAEAPVEEIPVAAPETSTVEEPVVEEPVSKHLPVIPKEEALPEPEEIKPEIPEERITPAESKYLEMEKERRASEEAMREMSALDREEQTGVECLTCGAIVPSGATSCPLCKTDIPKGLTPVFIKARPPTVTEKGPALGEIACPNCGAFIAATASECPICDAKLEGEVKPVEVAEPEPEPIAEFPEKVREEPEEELPPVAPPPEPQKEQILCPSCGAFLEPGSTECFICGAKLGEEAVAEEMPAPETKDEAEIELGTAPTGPATEEVEGLVEEVELKEGEIICPSCSSIIPEGKEKCPECWADLTQYVKCPSCGMLTPAGEEACKHCQAPIAISVEEIEETIEEEVYLPEEVVIPETEISPELEQEMNSLDTDDEQGKECTVCGAIFGPEDELCPICKQPYGTVLEEPPEMEPAWAAGMGVGLTPTTYICPHCKEKIKGLEATEREENERKWFYWGIIIIFTGIFFNSFSIWVRGITLENESLGLHPGPADAIVNILGWILVIIGFIFWFMSWRKHEDRIECPKCGIEVTTDMAMCINCGTELEFEKEEEPGAELDEEEEAEDELEEEVPEEVADEKVDEEILETTRPMKGKKIETAPEPAEEIPEDIPEAPADEEPVTEEEVPEPPEEAEEPVLLKPIPPPKAEKPAPPKKKKTPGDELPVDHEEHKKCPACGIYVEQDAIACPVCDATFDAKPVPDKEIEVPSEAEELENLGGPLVKDAEIEGVQTNGKYVDIPDSTESSESVEAEIAALAEEEANGKTCPECGAIMQPGKKCPVCGNGAAALSEPEPAKEGEIDCPSCGAAINASDEICPICEYPIKANSNRYRTNH
jgi:hypothetical protein